MNGRPPAPVRAATGESGSAYIVALLVLVVLTIIGLSLALVTQTEVQIGANERTLTRTFYAADSGVGVAVAKVLVSNDHSAETFLVNNSLSDAVEAQLAVLDDRVDVTPMVPILQVPCNLCQINQGSDFYYMNHAVGSAASRVGLSGSGGEVEVAEQRVTVMIGLQPWQPSAAALAAAVPEELKKIHF